MSKLDLQIYKQEKGKVLSEIDRKGLSPMIWNCVKKQQICAYSFNC